MPGALVALRRVGPTNAFLIALAVALVGFLLPGWAGAVILLLIVATLAAVLRWTWPVTPARTRVMRVVVLVALVLVAVAKVT